MCSPIFIGVDTHAHVDPGYKLVTRSLKIYAALDYSVGIFWVRHAHTTGVGIFWGPSVGNWAYFEVATGVGACPSGPLSGHILGWTQVLVAPTWCMPWWASEWAGML